MTKAAPKFLPRFVHQYIGNGTVFQFLKPYESNPFIKQINSIYNLAPMSKWGLSIVPMMGVVTGHPPPDKIDVNTSGALMMTGLIWAVYALMITPQNAGSRALATVNLCMGTVNGYNVYRGLKYRAHKGGDVFGWEWSAIAHKHA